MPKETFWDETAVDGDGSNPCVAVTWGADHPGVQVNDVQFERSGLNRLIRTLRNARDKAYGRDE